MPVYKCRWANGDFSFVSAASQQEAIEALDEIGNAEGCPLSVVEDFMVHFHLEEDGTFQLEGFGEVTEQAIWQDYPVLDKTFDRIFEEIKDSSLTREHMKMISVAVKQERERVKAKTLEQPATLLGQTIKTAMDAPTSLTDREVEKQVMEGLKDFKPKGKPN